MREIKCRDGALIVRGSVFTCPRSHYKAITVTCLLKADNGCSHYSCDSRGGAQVWRRWSQPPEWSDKCTWMRRIMHEIVHLIKHTLCCKYRLRTGFRFSCIFYRIKIQCQIAHWIQIITNALWNPSSVKKWLQGSVWFDQSACLLADEAETLYFWLAASLMFTTCSYIQQVEWVAEDMKCSWNWFDTLNTRYVIWYIWVLEKNVHWIFALCMRLFKWRQERGVQQMCCLTKQHIYTVNPLGDHLCCRLLCFSCIMICLVHLFGLGPDLHGACTTKRLQFSLTDLN